jgi:hypothetical protein
MTTTTLNCPTTLVNSDSIDGKRSSDSSWPQRGVGLISKVLPNLSDEYHTTAFYKLTGRIPWHDIAENPSHHLSKKSQPDSDHKLQDPSHMKSDGVDAWLRHWLKLQKKGRRPLVLRDPTDKSSERIPKSKAVTKRKASQGKVRYIESDESDDQDIGNKSETEESEEPPREEGPANALVMSPFSASATRKTRRAFLESLSNDTNYKKLQLLLYAAKVSNHVLAHNLAN